MRCFIALLATGVLQLALGQAPCLQNHIHDQGRIAMNVASTSILGNAEQEFSDAMDDPCLPGRWAPQLEYPAGSGIQYLYEGCLWVGALLEEEDGSLTPRVSFGSEGWERNVTELYGGPSCAEGFHEGSRIPQAQSCDGAGVFDPAALADQEFTFVYSDTLANYPEVVPGQVFDRDDRDHRPLGLRITQHSYQWGVEPDFGSLLLLRYDIRNMSEQALHSPYVGLYLEGDVVGAGESTGGWQDDLVMFRSHAHNGNPGDSTLIQAMLFLDNDGREHNDFSGNDYVCPSVLALLPLGTDDLQVSFNWWNSNADFNQDYGPAWTWWLEHPEYGLSWIDTLGTPVADLHKYQVMSNGEIDPPWFASQWGNYPPQPIFDESGQISEWRAWTEPGVDEQVDPLGDNVRGLLSLGPLGAPDGFDELGRRRTLLSPGEQVSVCFALVMGDSLHQACCPQPDIENHLDPSLFDFTSLDRRLLLAKAYFESGLPALPMPPAPACDVSIPGQVRLSWTSNTSEPEPHYRLERLHLQSGSLSVLAEATEVTVWLDTIAEGDSLLYRLYEIWPSGLCSTAAELLVAPDYPPPVADLMVTPGDQRLDFTWSSDAPEVMIVHGVMPENSNRSTYCWPPECPFVTDTTWLENSGTASLTGLANLYRHFVKVHAVGANQLASAAEWQSVVPRARGLDWRILSQYNGWVFGADTASTRLHFLDLFGNAGLAYEYAAQYWQDPIARSFLDGCDHLWINMDSNSPFPIFTALRRLDLAHFQEAGGAFIYSGLNAQPTMVNIPLDPLNPADITLRHVPADYGQDHWSTVVPAPWTLQIDDPVLGSLFAASSEFSPAFRCMGFEEGGDWTHGGRHVAPGNDEINGRLASLTFTQPSFVHLSQVPMAYVDVEASRGYLNSLLEQATEVEPEPVAQPATFHLLPCAPNPFNPDTRVTFELDQAGEVDLRVYDLLGRQVRELVREPRAAGRHSVLLRGEGLASGVYFLRLESAGQAQTQKVLLLK